MEQVCGPIVVGDAHAEARSTIASLLRGLGYAVFEAASGAEVLAAARRERPALVVVDVLLPDISGYEVCRALRDDHGGGLPIVFVSGERTEPADQAAGLLVGADDYLVKPFAPDQLLSRVRRLLERTTPFGRALAARLTRREQQVLALLVDGRLPADIAAELVVSPKTVAKHIEHILAKLGVHSRTQAVALAARGRLAAP